MRFDVSVYVARAPYDEMFVKSATALLSPAEAERHARFRWSVDRDMFAVAHAVLRAAVAEHAGVPAVDVVVTQQCRICYGAHGQPVIPDGEPGAGLRLSLAHTRSMVVVGLSDRPVGVDVEALTLVDLRELSAALTTKERRGIRELSDEKQSRELLRAWVRKEAFCKGLGLGLTLPFDEIELWDPSQDEAIISVPAGHFDGEEWTVHDLQIDGHLVAVAYKGPAGMFAVFDCLDFGRRMAHSFCTSTCTR